MAPHLILALAATRIAITGVAGFLLLAATPMHAAQDDLRLEVARQWAEKGDYERAVQELRLFLNEHPDAAEVYARIGTLRLRQGKLKLAGENFKVALRKDPQNQEAKDGLVKVKEAESKVVSGPTVERETSGSGSGGKAARTGDGPAPKMAPDPAPKTPRNGEGPAAKPLKAGPPQVGGDAAYAPALDSLEVPAQGIYLMPEFLEALRLYRAHQVDAALLQLKKVLGKSPGHPGAYYLGGVIRYQKGDLEKAEFNFKRAQTYPQRGHNAHYYLARIHHREHRIPAAVESYGKYLQSAKSEVGRKQARGFQDQLQGKAADPTAHRKEDHKPAAGASAAGPGGQDGSGQGSDGHGKDARGKAPSRKDPHAKDPQGKDSHGDPAPGKDAQGHDPHEKDASGKGGHGKDAHAKDGHGKPPDGKDTHGKDGHGGPGGENRAGAPQVERPATPLVLTKPGWLPFVVADSAGASGKKLAEAYEAFKKEKFEKSAEILKEIIRLYGGSPNAEAASLDLAAVYVRLGLWDNAKDRILDYLAKAAEPQRYRDLAFYLEGLMHLGKKDGAKAERALLKVKAGGYGGPGQDEVDSRLAQAAELQQDNKKWAGYLEKALASARDGLRKARIQQQLGQMHGKYGRPEKASEHWRKSMEVCGKAPQGTGASTSEVEELADLCSESQLRVADLEFRRKRWKEAMAEYRKFTAAWPEHKENAWVQYQIANIYQATRNLESALNEYKKVIDNYPDSYWASQAQWKREDAIWRKEYEEVLD